MKTVDQFSSSYRFSESLHSLAFSACTKIILQQGRFFKEMSSSGGGAASGTIKVKNEMDLLRKDRLPSFKSRDLTLGGLASVNMKTSNTASTKREFKPNLNVQRNKNA